MKKIALLFMLLAVYALGFTQTRDRAAFYFSINQICFGYYKEFDQLPVDAEVYIGVANQDINGAFDDLQGGLKAWLLLRDWQASSIRSGLDVGLYLPNNDYYKAATGYLGINLEYEKYFGKNKRHSMLLDVGYRFGKRSYQQSFHNEIIKVNTVDEFKVSPMVFSIGYGFRI